MDARNENFNSEPTAKRNRRTVAHKWSDEETLLLIQLVEEQHSVWNFGAAEYKKLPVRDAAWRGIAERFDDRFPVAELNVKWQNLRTQFRKEYTKLKTTKSGQAAGNRTSYWKFFDAMSFVAAAEAKLSTISVSNISESDLDIDAVCEESASCQILSQPARGTATDSPSVQAIPDLSSGRSIRKRKQARRTDVSVYAENLERAMDIIAEPEDEFQIFGNYIASLLRNITNIDDARRVQRKVNMFTLNCIDELEAGPSSRHVENSPSIPAASPPVQSSTPVDGLEIEMEKKHGSATPEVYVPPMRGNEFRSSTPELCVSPSYESGPNTLTPELLEYIRENNSNVRFVGENGEYVDEIMSASELLKMVHNKDRDACLIDHA